ncbi:hypothetical protein DFQ27_004350 [Actinomortierella ambigua]|uniref:BHLH domain-containing protein n=1 Tax=Actinomortierella ambigua TaxID=1343610 RepID=A0A9P6Q276_9FUNG|nr:hypothetical protein DFQ27_004350 [Actinomortierella ambigua]
MFNTDSGLRPPSPLPFPPPGPGLFGDSLAFEDFKLSGQDFMSMPTSPPPVGDPSMQLFNPSEQRYFSEFLDALVVDQDFTFDPSSIPNLPNLPLFSPETMPTSLLDNNGTSNSNSGFMLPPSTSSPAGHPAMMHHHQHHHQQHLNTNNNNNNNSSTIHPLHQHHHHHNNQNSMDFDMTSPASSTFSSSAHSLPNHFGRSGGFSSPNADSPGSPGSPGSHYTTSTPVTGPSKRSRAIKSTESISRTGTPTTIDTQLANHESSAKLTTPIQQLSKLSLESHSSPTSETPNGYGPSKKTKREDNDDDHTLARSTGRKMSSQENGRGRNASVSEGSASDRTTPTPSNHGSNGNSKPGPTTAKRKPYKELLTEEEKRANHIASEQKRRNTIRNGFKDMTEIIPELRDVNSSKSTILFKAVDFIKQLERQNRILQDKASRLESRVEMRNRGSGLDDKRLQDIPHIYPVPPMDPSLPANLARKHSVMNQGPFANMAGMNLSPMNLNTMQHHQ